MARRYDAQTTTFSPEGRLYQVEYAIAAIQNAAAAVAIVCAGGVVLAAERRIASALLRTHTGTHTHGCVLAGSDKMYTLDEHVVAAVAGLTSDANILVAQARLVAQQHRYTYGEGMPVEALVARLADTAHAYTQYGGLRPYGCAFLFAGWDRHFGWQVYASDPSGNFSGWKAHAIGAGSTVCVDVAKAHWKEDMSLHDGQTLAVKALLKAMDTASPSSEKVELAVITRTPEGEFVQAEVPREVVHKLVTEALATGAAAEGGAAAPAPVQASI